MQDRHLFPFGKKSKKANVEYAILHPLFVSVFFRFEKHFLFSREAVFFVPSAKCVSLPSLKKRKRKEGNRHAVGIRRQEGGAAILLAFSSGKTFPSFFQKRKRKKRRERSLFPAPGKRTKRKGQTFSSAQRENLLSTFFPKKREKKKAPSLRSLPFFATVRHPCRPFFFRVFPLLHSSKRREAASHRYAGRSKRC